MSTATPTGDYFPCRYCGHYYGHALQCREASVGGFYTADYGAKLDRIIELLEALQPGRPWEGGPK